MKLSKHAKFWALGALGGVWLFALGVFAQQNGALDIDSTNQDLFSDLKAVFFLERKEDNNEIDSIVRLNVSNGTVVSAPTSDLAGGEAKNTLQNNASIIGSTNSVNTSSGAFLIATNSGRVEGESMQSFVWGASNTTLKGYNAIAVATKNTNLKADNTLALAAKDSTVSARDSVVLGGENITINPAAQASLAIWSKINVLGASGALVFNGKTSPLQVDTASAHTMVVNADNGLIINTNNSNNQKIQLTVNGAIKLGAVANAPTQTSPYLSTKRVGNVSCICAKTNNEISALSKYSRNNKQHTEICQKVCNNETPTLLGQCGAAATNYPLTQTQWSTDDFCQWGLGYAGAKPTFPTLGAQVSWTCESFPSGGPTCTATRKGCGDGIRATGEQCDLGTNNGKPDSSCSISCETVKDPKCGANAKTYSGSDVAWAQPNGFCTNDSVLSWSTPNFRSNCNKCGLRGFPYCFDVSFDANSAICKSSSQSDIAGTKTWTCKNKNGKNLTCTTTKQPPMVAGKCNLTQLGKCDAWVLSWAIKTINNGKRWECAGLYGGSNNTCSTCNNGYTYNETSTECETTTCPSWFTTYSGKCVQWQCEIRTKPWTERCIGSTSASKCGAITQENLCKNSYEMQEICTSIGLPCHNFGRVFITKERASTFPDWAPVGIGKDPSKWVIVDIHDADWSKSFVWSLKNSAHASKVGPCQWWEKEAVVLCKDTSGNILPDGNCNSPKPEKEDLCEPISPRPLPPSTTPPRPPKAPLNGQCKFYPWNHTSQPATSTANGCLAGDYQDIPDDTNKWKWKCNGKNGGTSIECSTSKHSTCPSGFTASNGKCVKRECKKEEKCNCFVSQGRVQVACEGLPAGLEGFCYRELPPKPTITEDTKQQCESKPQCQWREVNRSICVDNNSNKLSDVACSSIGPKLDCNRPQTPPPPPGPPAQLKINGQCKTYAWSHISQPATNTTNGCLAGDYEDLPDDTNNWKWKCKGKNWGNEANCSAAAEKYKPTITISETWEPANCAWKAAYMNVVIKNPAWKLMKVEYIATLLHNSHPNLRAGNKNKKVHSGGRVVQATTSETSYQFKILVPVHPYCVWSVQWKYTVYVTIDWQEFSSDFNYKNKTKEMPWYPQCCIENLMGPRIPWLF